MTDKKKLDEMATLNVSHEEDGITATTTFTADDAIGLAALLKRAGIKSEMFNGSATLMVDGTEPGSSISSTIQAPDLRSIMNILEPEFQASSDMGVDDAMDVIATDDAVGMVANPENYEVDMDGPATIDPRTAQDIIASDMEVDDVDMGVDLDQDIEGEFEGEFEESAEYDYRTHDQTPEPYAGVSDKQIVQPETHATPARAGDNPLGEQTAKSFKDYVQEAAKKNSKKRPAYSAFGSFFPGYVGRRENEDNGEDTSADLGFDVGGGDMFEDDLDELSKATVKGYVKTVNQDDHMDADAERIRKRGRGLGHAQAKIYWKDAQVLATEAEETAALFQEFNDPALGRSLPYYNAVQYAKNDSKNGYVQHVDRTDDPKKFKVSDWKSDKTVASFENGQQIGGLEEEQLDELSNDTKNRYFKKAAGQIDQHSQLARDDRELGNHDNADAHGRVIQKRAQGMNRAIAREDAPAETGGPRYTLKGYNVVDTRSGETVDSAVSGHEAYNLLYWWNSKKEIDESPRDTNRNRMAQMDRKTQQYGPAYYLNTDCGFASLDDIRAGNAQYFDDMTTGSTTVGVTVLEIDRSGKKGFNYVTSLDSTPDGTQVTCITQTSTGQKFRPGRVVTKFTSQDLVHSYDMVVSQLSQYGITPSKKLSVKTFD